MEGGLVLSMYTIIRIARHSKDYTVRLSVLILPFFGYLIIVDILRRRPVSR